MVCYNGFLKFHNCLDCGTKDVLNVSQGVQKSTEHH